MVLLRFVCIVHGHQKHYLKVIPKTAKKIAVLDRTKEPGSLGEPLYLDVATTLREAGIE